MEVPNLKIYFPKKRNIRFALCKEMILVLTNQEFLGA